MVATVRALKVHGGIKTRRELTIPSAEKVAAGLCNLEGHLENVARFGKRAVVAINRFHTDSDEELDVIVQFCVERGIPYAMCDHFARGGAGAEDLARALVAIAKEPLQPLQPIYNWSDSVEDKIRAVATQVYGASGVVLSAAAQRDVRVIESQGFGGLPICVAKTQSSFSDNPRVRGRPTGFELTVRGVTLNAGAGFLVVLTGDIMRMPGLPASPQAELIDVVDGEIVGIA
jgi:formate--tetrahydrofolate ligase